MGSREQKGAAFLYSQTRHLSEGLSHTYMCTQTHTHFHVFSQTFPVSYPDLGLGLVAKILSLTTPPLGSKKALLCKGLNGREEMQDGEMPVPDTPVTVLCGKRGICVSN